MDKNQFYISVIVTIKLRLNLNRQKQNIQNAIISFKQTKAVYHISQV